MSVEAFSDYLRHELYRSPLTVSAYLSDLSQLSSYVATLRDTPSGITDDALLASATQREIRSWISTLADSGEAPASLRRKLQSARSYYRFLLKRREITTSPAADIPMPRTRRKLPQTAREGDIERLIADSRGCPEDFPSRSPEQVRDTLIIELLYTLGLRRAELLGLDDNDIDLSGRQARILGKGGKTRIIPLSAGLCGAIAEWQRLRDATWPDLPRPRPIAASSRGRLSPSGLYRIVTSLLSATAASRKSPHTLRHTCATAMLNAGADLQSIKDLLGHASLAATQIYTHVSFSDLRRDWLRAHPRAHRDTDGSSSEDFDKKNGSDNPK